MRIRANEVFGLDKQVGKVAAPPAGHQDFLPDLVGFFQHQYPAATLARGERAHQSRGACAKHHQFSALFQGLDNGFRARSLLLFHA